MTQLTTIQASGLLVITEKIREKLTLSETQIALISNKSEENLRVFDMEVIDRFKLATVIVTKAEHRLGSAYKDKLQQKVWITEIESDFKKFINMTGLELLKATELGLDGDFNENGVVVFSPSAWVMWVKAFIAKYKQPVMKKLAQLIQQQESEQLPPSEKDRLNGKFKILELAIQKTLEGEVYQDYGGVLYALLEDFEYLVLTPDEKWKAMDRAKLMMLNEAKDTRDRSKISSVMKIIKDYGQGIMSEAVTSTAKRLIVSEKLKSVTEDGSEDAQDFLDNFQSKISDRIESLYS